MTATSLPTNVAELLSRAATAHGDKVAAIDADRTITWSDLDAQADGVAAGLTSLGLVAGHRVALALENSIEFLAAYLGILRGGMVAVPLNPTSTSSELERVFTDSGARVCFADAATVGRVREAIEATTSDRGDGVSAGHGASAPLVVCVGVPPERGESSFAALSAASAPVISPRDAEALAVLLYTSGTSGRPRGAMLSHRALLANIDQASRTDPPPMRPDDLVLGVLPLFHVYGLNAVLGQVLLQGATLVLGKRFDPGETLSLVASSGVTCVPVAPRVIVAWRDREDVAVSLGGVRTLLSGAAPLDSELVREFEARTGVAVEQGYGLTEAAPIVTTTVGTPVHKPGSSGRAIPGVELRVVDDAGTDVEADDPGEILVRGDNVFSGYWPDGDGGPDDDGWLATGDIGFLDPDGDLFMVDRLKELVIVSGFNVYPSEIEEVVLEVDGVAECAVIGVPDDDTGEAVIAYVVPRAGLEPEELSRAISEHCGARLARFKLPSAVHVVDALPHSATGKVAKGRLRAAEARRAMGMT